MHPPRLGRPHRLVDAFLLLGLLLAALQLVPLPPPIRLALSPALENIDRVLRLDAPLDALNDRPRPLSLDPEAGAWAVALAGIVMLTFWAARTTFEHRGGVRVVARAVAWCGLLLTAVVFVQRALSPDLMYGFWRPIARIDNPHPIGPFLNRNDLAAWLIVAIPLVMGYAIAHVDAHSQPRSGVFPVSAVDTRTVTLAAALCLMVAALLASLSRSGLAGVTTGVATVLVLGSSRLPRARLVWLAAVAGALVLFAATYANLPELVERLAGLSNSASGGRMEIWRQTWPMVRHFSVTGVGVGAFQRGMSVYQQSTRLLFFNHAHNEYLQVLAEGGWPLALTMGGALVGGGMELRSRLRNDSTPMFFVRTGAAGSLAALAVQSIWHVGIRMPATAVLFAISAAIALHLPSRRTSKERGVPIVAGNQKARGSVLEPGVRV